MRILITRHGQTEHNVKKIIAGSSETPLTELGKRQAEAIAKRLAKERIDSILSSPLSRAVDTARYIGEATGLVVKLDERLRERNFGAFEGKPTRDYFSALESSGVPRHLFLPPDGEGKLVVLERLQCLINDLHQYGGNVLLVGHQMVNRLLIKELAQEDWRYYEKIKQENTCLNIFERVSNKYELKLLNCVSHLDGLKVH